jgi:GTP:adenosylcobinamide-phosphate guanylyltransferase
MKAIITAGGCPSPEDPLFEITQGQPKALVNIAGKPMIQWVLDALEESGVIDQLVIVGLKDDEEFDTSLPTTLLPNQGDMLSNITIGARAFKEYGPDEMVMIVSSDVPTITGQMIKWFAKELEQVDADAVYNIIEKDTMETRFPNANRTYLKLGQTAFCGGDVNAVRLSLMQKENPMWKKLIDARKNPIKQVTMIGLDTLFMLITKKLTLAKAEQLISKKLGLKGKALTCPYAELAMDVDKPGHFSLLEQDLIQA